MLGPQNLKVRVARAIRANGALVVVVNSVNLIYAII